MSVRRYNCYVSVNSIKPGVRLRTKDAIGHVRHVFLETDQDGSQLLATIANRRDLPTLSYIIKSSPNRLHVLWRVSGFTTDRVERLQRHLAHEVGTDAAATPCSQTTRLPAYRNHKRTPASLVTIQYEPSEVRYTPLDFPAPPAPSPCQPTRPLPIPRASLDVIERVRRYLTCVEPAISGQHGDLHTFRVCCRIVRGFALTDSEAVEALADWNARCNPPWTEDGLRHKNAGARRYGREPIGALLSR